MAEALVVPGGAFGPAAGPMYYVGAIAGSRGATVHSHTWSTPHPDPFAPGIEAWVRAEIDPVLDAVGGAPLLIGKSLGTNAAVIAAERALPAVWVTPLLTVPWVVAAMGRATAPFLLVGGTADHLWDPVAARRLTPHVLEVERADHGMGVPGPVAGSVTVLGRIAAAVEEFFDAVGWPG